MRVLHVIHGLRLGGLEKMVVELCAHGRRLGIESKVLAFGEDGAVRQLAKERGIAVELLEGVAGMTPTALRCIASAAERFGAQLLHGHDTGPWLNAVASRALRRRSKVVGTFHQLKLPRGKLK